MFSSAAGKHSIASLVLLTNETIFECLFTVALQRERSRGLNLRGEMSSPGRQSCPSM